MVTVDAAYAMRRVFEAGRVDAVLAFYDGNPDAHVWPRTRDELSKLAGDGCLFEVVDTRDDSVVAACYTKDDEEPDGPHAGSVRWEIGGLYLAESVRGTKLAEALVRVAIISLYALLDPHAEGQRLIGHVHEFNDKPRRLLEALGFEQDGFEIPPAHAVPPNLTRNAEGEVVGHLFVFRVQNLGLFADWLEKHNGRLENGAPLTLDGALSDRASTVVALRDIAQRSSSST
jgi:hypothetical protein